jgi:hypothetical protein
VLKAGYGQQGLMLKERCDQTTQIE